MTLSGWQLDVFGSLAQCSIQSILNPWAHSSAKLAGIVARILIVQFYQEHGRDFILCCINATSLWASQPSLKDDLADENLSCSKGIELPPDEIQVTGSSYSYEKTSMFSDEYLNNYADEEYGTL